MVDFTKGREIILKINKEIDYLYNSLTFLNKLTIEEQELVRQNTRKVKYKQGDNIHGGINHCEGILIIKSGCIRTYLLSDKGKEVTLYLLEEGEVCVLSASCILNNITFDVHIDVEEDSEVFILDLEGIEKISKNIYVENFLLNEAVTRFSDVMWAMEKIIFLKFDQRLAIYLLDHISRNSSDIIIQTHEQIANHLGSAREVVSRMLSYFSREGIVKLSRGEIKVEDKDALRELI